VIERHLEASVETLEGVAALQRLGELVLEILIPLNSIRARIALRSDRPVVGPGLSRCTERKLESALTHEIDFPKCSGGLADHPRARSCLHY
jgi:hypothetical protein